MFYSLLNRNDFTRQIIHFIYTACAAFNHTNSDRNIIGFDTNYFFSASGLSFFEFTLNSVVLIHPFKAQKNRVKSTPPRLTGNYRHTHSWWFYNYFTRNKILGLLTRIFEDLWSRFCVFMIIRMWFFQATLFVKKTANIRHLIRWCIE